MFGRRPRYDDTFGVRMDLGADRVEPMAMRPAAQVRVKETILIERPGSDLRRLRAARDRSAGRAARQAGAPDTGAAA